MTAQAEMHLLKTRIQALEQDVRISLSKQEIKLHDRLYIAAIAELVCMVQDDAPGKSTCRAPAIVPSAGLMLQ